MTRSTVVFTFLCGALCSYIAQVDWSTQSFPIANQAAATQLVNHSTSTKEISLTEYVESMSLANKIGQLLIIGHWKPKHHFHTKNMLELYQFGGVIIMGTPDDASSIPTWITEWNTVSEIPPLISIDQEGGVVSRLKSEDFTQTDQRSLESTDEASVLGRTRGAELASLGINTNLAPVLDYASSTNSFLYDRSFSNAADVASFSAALITGHNEANVLAIPKHYPGHPNTPSDSHFVLPVVDVTAADFPKHVAPFKDLLDSNSVGALMTAHVQFPKLDAEYPATLSYEIITRQLRRELGFSGVVITDDMTMGAITNYWTFESASVKSIEAGADMILFAAEPNTAMKVHAHLVQAVTDGTLSEERVDESVLRILTLKQKRGLLER